LYYTIQLANLCYYPFKLGRFIWQCYGTWSCCISMAHYINFLSQFQPPYFLLLQKLMMRQVLKSKHFAGPENSQIHSSLISSFCLVTPLT
jgi:hypothetical protein